MKKIAVVDTKVNTEHKALKNHCINHIYEFSQMCDSVKTHGTAVCGEIARCCDSPLEIDVFPVFNDNFEADPEAIIACLKYIEQDDAYKIVNMSLGIEDPQYAIEIDKICRRLTEKGVVLVSAFDNWGSMTYPACLDTVIGVDVSNEHIGNADDYIYVEGSCINIVFQKMQKIVNWHDPDTILAYGSSFNAAYITGMLCRYLQDHDEFDLDIALAYLKENAKHVTKYEIKHIRKMPFDIKKAVMFPFNKEIESAAKLNAYLPFELVDVFDFRHSRHIGEHIVPLGERGETYSVKSIRSIDWDSFDTIIIGHLNEHNDAYKLPVIDSIVEKCKYHNKNIYCFDSLLHDRYGDAIESMSYYPSIEKNQVHVNQLGKMWNVPIPVIAILGTRSRLGKHTVQVKMTDYIRKIGYDPGFLSTEPSGYLFGADYVFPYGFGSTANISIDEYALVVNDMVYNIFLSDKDIILAGLQSQTIPLHEKNINQSTIKQFSLLFGLSPDGIIMCVSPDDDIEYIVRTIDTMKSLYQVILYGILVSPVRVTYNKAGIQQLSTVASCEIMEFIKKLEAVFSVPVKKIDDPGIFEITEYLLDRLVEG
jgi:hypothetical protein